MTDSNPTLFDQPYEIVTPILPYGGTSGWSGSDTSRERADKADSTGLTSGRQQYVYNLVRDRGADGATWKLLSKSTGWHHGTASGVLSVLHKAGHLVRLTEKRDGCQVYVLPQYANGRTQAPYKPNVSAQLLTDVLVELLDDLTAGRVDMARARVAATLHHYNALGERQ